MIGLLALLGSLILAGTAVFTYFGGYWYELLRKKDDE